MEWNGMPSGLSCGMHDSPCYALTTLQRVPNCPWTGPDTDPIRYATLPEMQTAVYDANVQSSPNRALVLHLTVTDPPGDTRPVGAALASPTGLHPVPGGGVGANEPPTRGTMHSAAPAHTNIIASWLCICGCMR